ncbi:MAG: serine/threonine protein kinase [Leptospira sp.]|nr:serine/threonine protein kinase [Leptospira sp.]
MNINESFFHLDLDQILNCIEDTGLNPTGHCLALNSLENRVYRIGVETSEDEDVGENGEGHKQNLPSVVVKFYRPGRWTKEQIQEEHDFLFQLEESEIPVLTPMCAKNGETIHSSFIQPDDKSHPIFYTLWPTLKGRIVEEFTNENLPAVGRLLARIHNIGSSERATHRINLDIENYGQPALNFILQKNFLTSHSQNRYQAIAEKIFDLYKEVSQDIPKFRIHGDCHKGNLLQNGESFTFLDFDDFMTGIPVQDLWMLLPFGEPESEYAIQTFMEGYQEFRDFEPHWFQAIEPLRGIRYIYYSSWVARRWEDPAFQNAFPHFGTESYWEKEIRDLEQLYYNFID